MKRCLNCNNTQLELIYSTVNYSIRFPLGKALGIDYSLGSGSGITVPMTLCINCGMIQGEWPNEISE